jgi:glycosyltransferase involved in cell wall biosynthesis
MAFENLEDLRVLLITNTLSISGGSESLVLNIFHSLKKRQGVKVKLVTLSSEQCPTGYEIPGIEQSLISDPDFYDCGSYINLSVTGPNRINITEFVNYVNAFQPHVIHSNLFISELIAHEVIFPGVKYITHCHDNIPQLRRFGASTLLEKKLFTDFYEKQHLVKRYQKCNNTFIAISEDSRDYFKRVLPAKLNKNIFLLPNAIVTKNFEDPGNKKDLNTIKLINVGAFIPLKNQQLLVDITHELIKRGHKVEVTMLGSGPEYNSVKNKVEAFRLSDVISMPGTKVNVADYYHQSNLYVHTCTHEAFGLVFLEAMASGLPVVSLDAKGNRQLVKDGENGIMINEQNPVLFADAIEKIVGNRNLYNAMSSNAAAFAKKHDIEEYTSRLIALYKAAPKAEKPSKTLSRIWGKPQQINFGFNIPGSDPEKEQLRILLIANTMTVGAGAEALVLNIFNGLKKRPGIKVKLITLKSAAIKTGFDIPGVEAQLAKDSDFFDSNSYVNLSVLKPNSIDVSQLIEIIQSFKPNVIHSHLFLSELVSHEVVFPGIKYFSHCHDNMSQLRNFSLKTLTQKNYLTSFFEKQHLVKRYLKCNNKFISISNDTFGYFASVLPRKLKGNIYPLSNAIVIKNFRRSNSEPDLKTIRIINVGRFTTLKNQQFLVDVTAALLKRGHKVQVVMLGKGEEHERVKAKVVSHNLESVISMPGTSAVMADYYASSNIYVHVCRHEPFGLVLLEAMASGLPVVTLDGLGNRGLIAQGQNGYMLTEENADLFADTIEKVFANKDTYSAMSVNAVAFARRYDFEEYLSKLIRLYRFG